ncbi:hypothetical protein PPSIR1_06266 [Plesiocystis pacifica SIR-1]|uniref:Uncharacterized protein n=1 Tax=Plesiocystis pacifica SIR-1 TaxID=391625 RepID=A6G6X8_9BACT|nr:hypothetical protein PPSIR1_06266 [Plesiocystis pacifica SIR-1]
MLLLTACPGGGGEDAAGDEVGESGDSEDTEGSESESESESGSSSSSDSESDTDTDTSSETATDTESSSETDTESESSTETDTDTDTESGSETDTGTDTDTPFECDPVEPPVPPVDCADAGILLTDEFAPFYECFDLGSLPTVPSNWGGLTVKIDDPNVLLIGGSANTANGQLYSVEITRDEGCHVTGWAGTPIEPFAEAAFNDGGVTYGPDDVLFLARWPNNELGQQALGSVTTDKIIDLDTFMITPSPGGLNFVPPGFAGEGQLKLVSWSGGEWYTLELAPDGNGLFDIVSATLETQIVGGPEGFVHIGADNPGFPVDGLLVSEYSAGTLAAYDADDNGDPVVDSRRDFVTGLTGAEGAYLDALSGDFLFTTFGGGNRLIAIRGFTPNPQ